MPTYSGDGLHRIVIGFASGREIEFDSEDSPREIFESANQNGFIFINEDAVFQLSGILYIWNANNQ